MLLWQRVLTLLSSAIAADSAVRMTLGITEHPKEIVMNLTNAHLRVARPTDKLVEVVKFYERGLGFAVLYQFTDHDGFDGVMLGHKDAAPGVHP